MAPLNQYLQTYFGVQADQLPELSQLFVAEQLEKGDFFIRQAQYCRKMSFVKSGYLRISAQVEDKEVTQWIAERDYFVTDLASFLLQTPARWQIQALTPVELFTISFDRYQKIHEILPTWPQIEKNFLTHCFITLENRVFSFLSMSAQERYEQLFQENPTLFNQIPLHYLASMLGMTPETFSRIRKNLSA